jgi:type II secretory pathway pseudopilin PulG
MKAQSTSSTKNRKSAFTLIEIMVATVVMVVLTGLVIQITSEVLKVWNRSSGKLAANANARVAMDLLAQDLESAVFRNNGLQWLRSEKDTTRLNTNTVSLKLFSSALDRPNPPNGVDEAGDICAIAYQLDRRDPVTGSSDMRDGYDNRLWILYRMVVPPAITFEHLLGAPEQDELPSTNKSDEVSQWRDSVNSPYDYDFSYTAETHYLVSNIVSFDIDFYVEDDGNITTLNIVSGDAPGTSFDTRYGCGLDNDQDNVSLSNGATVGPHAYNWVVSPSPQQLAYRKPLSYATIRLTVLSDQGAQMLQNIESDDIFIPETVEDVIRMHGETYIRRVNLSGGAL